jgi:hypothetical protein
MGQLTSHFDDIFDGFLALLLLFQAIWLTTIRIRGRPWLFAPHVWLIGAMIAKIATDLALRLPAASSVALALAGLALGGIALSAVSMFRMWTRWIHELPQPPPGQPPLFTIFMTGLFISLAAPNPALGPNILAQVALFLMMINGASPFILIIALMRAHRSRSVG